MGESARSLLDQAIGADDSEARRQAFLTLLQSEKHWRSALSSDVLGAQGQRGQASAAPDPSTLAAAAAIIAKSPEKVRRALQLTGIVFSGELLAALAQRMDREFVRYAVEFLPGAAPVQKLYVIGLLRSAYVDWVREEEAEPVVRQLLRSRDELIRASTVLWLGQVRQLTPFLAELEAHDNLLIDEWSALGRCGMSRPRLVDRGMALLPRHPAPLLYLLRLEKAPDGLGVRVLASAQGDWLATALELAAADGLTHPLLIPLAELGMRLGGRSVAAATTWISSSRIGRDLLHRLAGYLRTTKPGTIPKSVRTRRGVPSGARGLARAKKGAKPEPHDVAELIRLQRGEQARQLVREILASKTEAMMRHILHPLCAVNSVAADEVLTLCESPDAEVKSVARRAANWRDVLWPTDDDTLA